MNRRSDGSNRVPASRPLNLSSTLYAQLRDRDQAGGRKIPMSQLGALIRAEVARERRPLAKGKRARVGKLINGEERTVIPRGTKKAFQEELSPESGGW